MTISLAPKLKMLVGAVTSELQARRIEHDCEATLRNDIVVIRAGNLVINLPRGEYMNQSVARIEALDICNSIERHISTNQ